MCAVALCLVCVSARMLFFAFVSFVRLSDYCRVAARREPPDYLNYHRIGLGAKNGILF